METKYFVTAVIVTLVAVTLIWLIFIPHPDKYDGFENLAGVGAVAGPGRDPGEYTSRELGWSVRAPDGFEIQESYVNQSLGPDLRIPGVAFVVPRSLTAGTNLSPDSFISVESLQGRDCSPSSFIYADDPGRRVFIGGVPYMYAESRTAGAGNLYDEAVYVSESRERCVAVRRFMHITNINNYPAGTVREFDRRILVDAAESVARSLVIR